MTPARGDASTVTLSRDALAPSLASARRGMRADAALPYRRRMQFPDSTYAALRLDADRVELPWARLLWVAVALTGAAACVGLLAGG